jgi:hypothetical protein
MTAAWFKGRLYDEVDGSQFFNALCGNKLICNGTILEKPQTIWWIRLRSMNRLMGWTKHRRGPPTAPERARANDARVILVGIVA